MLNETLTNNSLAGALWWLREIDRVRGLPYEYRPITEIFKGNSRAKEGWSLFYDWTVDVGSVDLEALTYLALFGRQSGPHSDKPGHHYHLRPSHVFLESDPVVTFMPNSNKKWDCWMGYYQSTVPSWVGYKRVTEPLVECWSDLYRAVHENGFFQRDQGGHQ